MIPQRPVLPKAQGDSSLRTLPFGARVTLPTPGFRPQRLPVPKPSWDKSRQPVQEPRTSGAVSPGPHGAAGRQRQRQLRERCVLLCRGVGGCTWAGAALLTLSPSSSPPPPHLLGRQCWEGGGQHHFPTLFPNCPEVRVWRRCHLPSGSCRELKQRKEEKQSALGQVARERSGIEDSG